MKEKRFAAHENIYITNVLLEPRKVNASQVVNGIQAADDAADTAENVAKAGRACAGVCAACWEDDE